MLFPSDITSCKQVEITSSALQPRACITARAHYLLSSVTYLHSRTPSLLKSSSRLSSHLFSFFFSAFFTWTGLEYSFSNSFTRSSVILCRRSVYLILAILSQLIFQLPQFIISPILNTLFRITGFLRTILFLNHKCFLRFLCPGACVT